MKCVRGREKEEIPIRGNDRRRKERRVTRRPARERERERPAGEQKEKEDEMARVRRNKKEKEREKEQRDQAASAPTKPPPYHLQHSQPAHTVAAAPPPWLARVHMRDCARVSLSCNLSRILSRIHTRTYVGARARARAYTHIRTRIHPHHYTAQQRRRCCSFNDAGPSRVILPLDERRPCGRRQRARTPGLPRPLSLT